MNYLQKKKLAFMSIVNQVKGFVRTISGVPPITLENCVDDKSVIDYKIDGNSVQSQLASIGYQCVEYIESSGSQYIDTGVIADKNTGFEIEFLSKNTIGTNEFGCVFGARTSSGINEYQLTSYCHKDTPDYLGTFRFGTTSYDGGISVKEKCVISLKNSVYIKHNGDETILEGDFTTPCAITIFALNHNGLPIQYGKIQLFSFKIYDGDNLIRDFIPCFKISDNTVGLYDLVGNEFYENKGTGTFTKGSNCGASPDNPVEVMSVGERTANLVDFYDAFTKPNYIHTSGNIRCKHIQLEAYTEYTLSTNAEKTTTINGTATYQIFIGSGQLQSVTGAANGVSVGNSRTITTDANGYLTIAIRAYDGKDVVTEEEILNGVKWIMLNKTSVALPYEPFDYYKIPITASGKNLFDISNTSGWITSTYRYYSIYVGANKKVRVSWDNDLSAGQGFYLCIGNTQNEKGNGNAQGGRWLYHDTSSSLRRQSISVTADEEGFIYINMQPLKLNKLMKLQVECPEPITTNIYLKEPLRAIGNYKDYIDSEKQQVVRKIYHEFLDTVTTMSSEGTTYKRFLTDISKKPFLSNTNGSSGDVIGHAISNKFKRSTYTYNQLGRELKSINSIQSYITTTKINRVAYVFDDSSITTVAQAQELIGDGFDVYYVLAEDLIETIDLSNLPTFKGTTIYTIGTTVPPSNMEFTYYSTEKE